MARVSNSPAEATHTVIFQLYCMFKKYCSSKSLYNNGQEACVTHPDPYPTFEKKWYGQHI